MSIESTIEYDIIDGVVMGNYRKPSSTCLMSLSGQVMIERNNYDINRQMFHPYNGSPPIHCAQPAGNRTYHRPDGYS